MATISNTSVTAYSFISRSPLDSGGAKFMPLIRADASVATFSLFKGIGTSVNSASIMFSHLAVGTATQASPIENFAPFVGIGGVYLDDWAASRNSVQSGQGKIAGISKAGEIFSTGASRSVSLIINGIVQTTSQLVYGVIVSGDGVTAGDIIEFEEGNIGRFTYVFTAANETKYLNFDGPLFFTALNVVPTISGGAASVSLIIPAGIA